MPAWFLMMSIAGAGALAGALALIPLVVHLLHRQKVTPVAWGAMQFLLESPLRVRRRRKIDNWVLMLLRMAILMVLVFLLCRPVWRTEALAASTPVDVAVVIDHSMTMGLRQGEGAGGGAGGAGGGTLYERGIDVAESISKILPASGTMSVVLAENTPRLITTTPLKMGLTERADDGTPRGEWARQLQVMRSLKPGLTKGDIPAAVEAAREALLHGYNTRKVIFVVSDDQRTNWNPGDEKAWMSAVGHGTLAAEGMAGMIPVYDVPVKPAGGGSGANVTVRSVIVLPEFLGVHRPAQVVATVSNSGGKDLTGVPVKLEVDGKPVMSRTLPALAVGESTSVRFDYYFPEAGSHWVRVRADVVDALDADNAATAAVNVKARLPVLVVDGQLTPGTGAGLNEFPQAGFLLAAMQPVDPTVDPTSLIEPKVISVAELATLKGVRLEDYAIVVLNDVPRLTREMVDRLAAHAQAGNGVWIILGPRTEASFINDVLAKGLLLPMTTKGIAHAPAPQPGDAGPAKWVTVDIKEPANRAVTVLTNAGESEHSALADVTLRQWWTVMPVLPEMRTVMATTTGDPLVLEMEMGRVGGRAVVWTSSVGDLGWSNLPLVRNFLPLVNETLFNLASGQDAGQPRQLQAGRPIAWSGGSGTQGIESVQLLCPDGSTRTLLPELRGDHYYVEDRDTALPGLYEMRFSAPARAGATAPPAAYFSVNIDGEELDPAVLGADDFEWYRSHTFLNGVISQAESASGEGLAKSLEATRGGREFWWALGVLLLALLVTEVALTYRLVRQQAGKTLEEDGLERVMPRNVVQGGGA